MERKVNVLTTGHFDLVHSGHVEHFQMSALLGTHLTVGITSDEYVRSKKGDGYPIYSALQRSYIINSFDFVDRVVLIPGDNKKEFKTSIGDFFKCTDIHVVTSGWDQTSNFWARELKVKHDFVYVILDYCIDDHASAIIKRIKETS